MDDEHEHCIDDCLAAARLCERAALHCLDEGGAHAERERVDALILAAAAGSFLADLIRDESELTPATISFLAGACRRAAGVCRALEDDELLAVCAEACERCANCAPRTVGVVDRA